MRHLPNPDLGGCSRRLFLAPPFGAYPVSTDGTPNLTDASCAPQGGLMNRLCTVHLDLVHTTLCQRAISTINLDDPHGASPNVELRVRLLNDPFP